MWGSVVQKLHIAAGQNGTTLTHEQIIMKVFCIPFRLFVDHLCLELPCVDFKPGLPFQRFPRCLQQKRSIFASDEFLGINVP